MNLGRPATALCRTTLAATLEVLAGTTRPLAGREVARLATDGTAPSVLDALRHLVDHGLVEREVVGKTHLYRLNRDHLATSAVLELTGLRGALLDRLRATIHGWPIQPVHASLFGSAARGDGSLESDIDILVVRGRGTTEGADWREQLDNLQTQAMRWTGNPVRPLELSEVELTQMVENGDPLVDSWRQDAIHLVGKQLRPLLRAKA